MFLITSVFGACQRKSYSHFPVPVFFREHQMVELLMIVLGPRSLWDLVQIAVGYNCTWRAVSSETAQFLHYNGRLQKNISTRCGLLCQEDEIWGLDSSCSVQRWKPVCGWCKGSRPRGGTMHRKAIIAMSGTWHAEIRRGRTKQW